MRVLSDSEPYDWTPTLRDLAEIVLSSEARECDFTADDGTPDLDAWCAYVRKRIGTRNLQRHEEMIEIVEASDLPRDVVERALASTKRGRYARKGTE